MKMEVRGWKLDLWKVLFIFPINSIWNKKSSPGITIRVRLIVLNVYIFMVFPGMGIEIPRKLGITQLRASL